jgi:membrane-associated phospholipid phosphatase
VRRLFVLALAVVGLVAQTHAATAPDSSARGRMLQPGRRDAVFALGAAGAGAVAAAHDRAWSARASRDRSQRAHDLAALARPFGEVRLLAPALLATDALARLTGHEALGAATERIALSTAGAGALKAALSLAIGRARPDELPGAPDRFEPFSGRNALPSGHATLAFALAAGVSAEARTRWVPFVLYPAAGLTAWSRVHDRRHWPSDVIAGAALGTWVAGTLDRTARHRLPHGLLPLVWPGARGAVAGVRVSF